MTAAARRQAQFERRLSEQQIQRAVFKHFAHRRAPRVFVFHPANGGYRRPVEARILQGLGVTGGVPDIIAVREGHCFGLELKAEGGRVTRECLAAMERAGATVAVAVGLNQALQQLEARSLLRGSMSS
jgi:hypothetical protein